MKRRSPASLAVSVTVALLLTGAIEATLKGLEGPATAAVIPIINYFLRRSYPTFPPLSQPLLSLELVVTNLLITLSLGLCAFILGDWFFGSSGEEDQTTTP